MGRRATSRRGSAATAGVEAEIPDKLHFKIGEVSRITGVAPHVLRYWESEFGALRPQKTQSNQRLYRRRDVELLLTIKRLLYAEGFTIAGAKKKIGRAGSDARAPSAPGDNAELIARVRSDIEDILALVGDDLH